MIWLLHYRRTWLSDGKWASLQRSVRNATGADLVPSKTTMFRRALALSRLVVEWHDKCINSCVSFACPMYKDLNRCPKCQNARWKPVGANRTTFSLAGGPGRARAAQKPVSTYSQVDIMSLVETTVASPVWAQALLDAYNQTIHALAMNAPVILNFSTSIGMRHLRGRDGILHRWDVALAMLSDGAEWHVVQDPTRKVSGYFVLLRFPELGVQPRAVPVVPGEVHPGPDDAHLGLDPDDAQPGPDVPSGSPSDSFAHRNMPTLLSVAKPAMADVSSFHHQLVQSFLKAEQGAVCYNAAARAYVHTRAFCILKIGDTVEQQNTSGTVGAGGRCPCITCKAPGVLVTRRVPASKKIGETQTKPLSTRGHPFTSPRFYDDPYVWPDEKKNPPRLDIDLLARGTSDKFLTIDLRSYEGLLEDLKRLRIARGGDTLEPTAATDEPTVMPTEGPGEPDEGPDTTEPITDTTEPTTTPVTAQTGPSGSKKAFERARLATGVAFESPFLPLLATKAVFPFDWPFESLHTLGMNAIPQTVAPLFGKQKTHQGVMATPSDIRAASRLVIESRRMNPTSISGSIRDPMGKIGGFKADEMRSYALQALLPMFRGIVSDDVFGMLAAMVRMLQVVELSQFDTTEGVAPDTELRAYVGDPSGRRTVSLATVDHSVRLFLHLHEKLYTGYRAEWIKLCTPTFHRLYHLPLWLMQWGELATTASYGIEAKIGDMKRMALSPIHPIEEIQNKELVTTIIFAINNQYDIADINPPERDGTPVERLSTTHPQIPGLALCHPRSPAQHARSGLPADEMGCLMGWMGAHGYQLGRGEFLRWARVRLSTEMVMRSSYGEVNSRFFEGGFNSGRASTAETRRDGRSARIALMWTDSGTTEAVEVLSYVEVPVMGLMHPRLVAVVARAPTLHDRSNAYVAFNRHERWTMEVIGVEQLQTPVGLMKENSRGRTEGDGWCAVQRGHDLRVAPFMSIEHWN